MLSLNPKLLHLGTLIEGILQGHIYFIPLLSSLSIRLCETVTFI